MKKTKEEVSSGKYVIEGWTAARAHWDGTDRALGKALQVSQEASGWVQIKSNSKYEFTVGAVTGTKMDAVSVSVVCGVSLGKVNKLLLAIKDSHESHEEVGVEFSTADVDASVLGSVPPALGSAVFGPAATLPCLKKKSKGGKGKLERKAKRDIVTVFNDLDEYIERNKAMYSEWVSYALQANVDDSGVIAGGRNKIHLSQ